MKSMQVGLSEFLVSSVVFTSLGWYKKVFVHENHQLAKPTTYI